MSLRQARVITAASPRTNVRQRDREMEVRAGSIRLEPCLHFVFLQENGQVTCLLSQLIVRMLARCSQYRASPNVARGTLRSSCCFAPCSNIVTLLARSSNNGGFDTSSPMMWINIPVTIIRVQKPGPVKKDQSSLPHSDDFGNVQHHVDWRLKHLQAQETGLPRLRRQGVKRAIVLVAARTKLQDLLVIRVEAHTKGSNPLDFSILCIGEPSGK